ncbi:Abi-alpha family protein [Paraflavitalea sp. CAU 1676]|uniref:Abi-alpha family protein n=1 Tax=Paraflavitalea sp. CAU 1676 TaxID=3032598 RepID=UPI0023D99DE8|nr:Abi-alpha family protein [Paraflavitalea sp. CAU 1676]MDF2188316.1 Abi-alpha family protein [Paraflavitalea sp. CAU 1676]
MEISVKPIDTAIEVAKAFIQKVVSPPLEEVGGLLVDTVRSWRLKNQIRIIQNAENILKEKGISTMQVSLKVMAPLLEGCSLEDDEELQQKWASLLVNTIASDSKIQSTLFSGILKEMSKQDAQVFEVILEACTTRIPFQGSTRIELNGRTTIPMAFTNIPEIDLTFDNLKRLRLIRELRVSHSNESPVIPTGLGLKFIEACRVQD